MEPRHGASSFKHFLALCVALPYRHWGKYEFHQQRWSFFNILPRSCPCLLEFVVHFKGIFEGILGAF